MLTFDEWTKSWDNGTLQGTKEEAFAAVASQDGDSAVIIMGVGIEALVMVDGLDEVVRILKTVLHDMENPDHNRWNTYPRERGL